MNNVENIREELLNFRDSFGTCIIGSIDLDGNALSSYAPVVKSGDYFYLFISEIAEHFASIKANPEKIEIMFIEDESKAFSLLMRKRLRYKAKAIIIDRESQEFKVAVENLEEKMKGRGGIKTVKNMLDFRLIRLEFLRGRYVRGFGAAYDIGENGEIRLVATPHIMPNN